MSDIHMHIELRHLRTIREIHRQGGLARAADVLNITQSALSHQIKGMEEQAGVELFVRRAKPMRLSAAGMRMLALADRVLPEVQAMEEEFRALRSGRTGRLHLAIECHACFDWLLPVLSVFRRSWAEVDVDIRAGLAFNALPALAREDLDLVISSDPEQIDGVTFHPLFEYRPTLVCSASSPLAALDRITPDDLRDQMLITYPVDRARLDVFSQFLVPARAEPRAVRQVELTAVILMLVASDRGVSVLPDWVLEQVRGNPDFALRPLDGDPVRRLYAAVRDTDAQTPYVQDFLRLARSPEVRGQRNQPLPLPQSR